jgi:hypothetical protein
VERLGLVLSIGKSLPGGGIEVCEKAGPTNKNGASISTSAVSAVAILFFLWLSIFTAFKTVIQAGCNFE